MTRRARLKGLAFVGVFATLVGVAFALAPAPGPKRFRVEGNRIVAPDGHRFVIKGVVSPYGTFGGGDAGGLGRINEKLAARDFARIRALGANTVKVYVNPPEVSSRSERARLDRVVRAARAEGLLVILTGFYGTHQQTLRWVRAMARTHAGNPWVWLLPINEPGCSVHRATTASCVNWAGWQHRHRKYLRAIRAAGMRNPVVVNTPGFSWDVSGVERHPLGDRQVVLGAHRYANDERRLGQSQRAEIQAAWAGFTERRAVVLDELGNWNGTQFPNSFAWTRDMVRFARRWVARRGGSGAVGFAWRWSDPNTMVAPGGELTPWGRAFVRGYLRSAGG
jgi:hypothetical protein